MTTEYNFISFIPTIFSLAISDLHSTIFLISSWMSYNYRTLNPSKTEFLLIGLPQLASKIINPSLSLPTAQLILLTPSAKDLGFIFDSIISFSKQISSISSSCHIIFEISAVSDTPSISPLPSQLLPVSFTI